MRRYEGAVTRLLRMKSRLGVVVLLAAAAALTLSACGGSDPEQPSDGNNPANGMRAYTECLSKQGITLPTAFARPTARPSGFPTARPSGSAGTRGGFGGFGGFGQNPPDGVDAATWQAAQEACAAVRPTFGPGGNGGPGGRGSGGGLNAAYRNCLSEHGVTIGAGQQLSTADPKVAEALKVCAPLRPSSTPSN